MTDTASLHKQSAIITGGGRGIGRAIAEALAARGASLTLVGRTADVLATAAEEITTRHGVNAQFRTLDVTDGAMVDSVLGDLVRDQGAPSILVNNAGGAESAPFTRLGHATWENTLNLNLTSVYACTHAVLPTMLEAGYGRIVNIASTAGLKGFPYVSAYCAAKHGVVGLTRALALEVADRRVTVNAVCPGFTDTDMLRESIRNIAAKTGRTEAEARADLARANRDGRIIQPAEVAEAVARLCAPTAGGTNGEAITIDAMEAA
ncbi:MAG: 3-hydroxyacyl-CoA dehydrogenase [Alphaproteobacteria bacterium]|nr:3-hydroxyacyl-CoA dehydrogenase [Alphaproteobacteria bacterium]